MKLSLALTVLSAAIAVRADTPCADSRYPACDLVKMAVPDTYASYRVPEPPVVPKWTAFVKSLANPDYPWVSTAPSTAANDGGATGGAANAKGAAWGTVANAATEVMVCPKGQIAITFDDGPVLSDQSLAILKANGLQATFFLIGSNIANNGTHAQFVQNLYNAGHQIALHTWTHRQISLQSTDEVISEIIFNILAIYNVIGKVPRYFRPPYSAIDDRVRNILLAMGLRPAVWNIESLDADVGQAAPGGIDISGQTVTVDNAIAHTKNSLSQGYDPRWNYFPSANTLPGGRYKYDGFITLEHDINDPEIQIAQTLVPFYKSLGLTSVLVNACDQILPNASPYLDDNSVLTQFIKSIKLPLTADDYLAFTGTFPANPAGGASGGSGTATTTTKSGSAKAAAAAVVAAALAMAV